MSHPGNGWTLVVLAAGMARRYGGVPKQLEPLGPSGEALLEYALWDAGRAGATSAALVVRPELEGAFQPIRERWSPHLPISLAYQRPEDHPSAIVLHPGRTKPWGTVHAVLAAEHHLTGPFAVVNADDFYGAAAFEALGGFFGSVDPAGTVFGIVGYPLHDTLSRHGPVTRALLVTGPDGMVTGVEEITGIARQEHLITGQRGGMPIELGGDEAISMNSWAFTPAAFPLLRESFAAFLRDELPGAPDAECALPEAVGDLLRNGAIHLRLLPSGGGWMGLTHPADRPAVVAALSDLVARGAYPADLCGAPPGR